LASGAIAERNLAAGATLTADAGPAAAGRSAEVMTPDGTKVELPVLGFGGRAEVRFADTRRPGRYRLTVKGGDQPEQTITYVVPTPRAESDLTLLGEERWRQLEQGLGARRLDLRERPIAEAVAGPRGGRELWAVTLGAVLVLAIVEMFIGRAVARQLA
jgi:hypothetical protein